MYFRNADSGPKLTRRTSIFRRTLWHFLLLCAAVTLTLTSASFLLVGSLVLQRALSQTASIADGVSEAVDQAFAQARLRATILSQDELVRSAMAGRDTADEMLQRLLREDPSVTGVAVVALDGGVLTAAGEPVSRDSRVASVTPVIGEAGWDAMDVSVPLRAADTRLTAFLIVRHETEGMLRKLTDALPPLGASAVLQFGFRRDGALHLVQPAREGTEAASLIIGGADGLPLGAAVDGLEGSGEGRDHRGAKVLAAWRSLQPVEGGLVVQVDRGEVMAEVRALAATLLALGALLFVFAALVALLLARSLTRSILSLASKVEHLGPGSWGYSADLRTGDEVQLLDMVVGDMASRLKGVYENMEGEIQVRTRRLQEQFVFDRTILDSILHGIVAVDAEGRISAVNPSALRIMGRKHEELLDAPAAEAIPVRRGDQVLTPHPLETCLSSGQPFRPAAGEKLSVIAADGTIVPVMVLAAPLSDQGKLFGAVMVFQDVRDERLMDELKSEFITLASHQLRTPLSILGWQMEVLKGEDGLSQTAKDCVDEMDRANSRMTSLLNALLKVAQLEGGRLDPHIEALDLCSIARDVTDELRPLAEQRKIHFSLACPARPLEIASDASLLRIVVHNLLTNAVKYTRDGTDVDVIVQQDGEGAKVMVTDRGLGIPEAEQRLLFTKFFRGRNIRTVDTDGNGLGLYIIKMIVEGLGGGISFVSAEGKGTTFTVRLPARAEKKAQA